MDRNKVNSLVKSHFTPLIPPEILFLAGCATNDLFHGPRESREDDPYVYSGFTSATKKIKEYNEENLPGEIYYDDDSGQLLEILPKYEEVDGESYQVALNEIYELTQNEMKCAIYGKELSGYV